MLVDLLKSMLFLHFLMFYCLLSTHCFSSLDLSSFYGEIKLSIHHIYSLQQANLAYVLLMFLCLICNITQVKRICPNDPDASKKLKECEKAVMKLKFEEAIAVPGFEKRSVADSIDFHTIGIILFITFCRLKHSSSSAKELV